MKGFERKIDDLGRLVIPKEMREACGIQLGEPVEMELTEGGILVRSTVAHCVFCGRTDYLVNLGRAALCEKCLDRAELQRDINHEE